MSGSLDSRSGIAEQRADPWQLDPLRRVETAQDNTGRTSTSRQPTAATDGWNTLGSWSLRRDFIWQELHPNVKNLSTVARPELQQAGLRRGQQAPHAGGAEIADPDKRQQTDRGRLKPAS